MEFVIDFEAKEPFTATKSFGSSDRTADACQCKLFQVKDANGQYRTLSEFQINRSNPAFNVGFDPYAPVMVSFPATTATSFRLIIKNTNTRRRIC